MPRTLDMIPATIEQRDNAAEVFCGITPLVELSYLKRLTDEGFLEACVVMVKDQAHYCVWLAGTPDRGLHVNACVQLIPKPAGVGCIISMLESLAEQRGFKYIRFNTARPGLIAKTKAYGFEAQSVCMIKKLS
jgi:hypothetical protein